MLLEETKVFSEAYKKTIKEALDVLGKKNLALIVQGVSFPSYDSENTGFGTYNSSCAKSLFNYVKGVFNCITVCGFFPYLFRRFGSEKKICRFS